MATRRLLGLATYEELSTEEGLEAFVAAVLAAMDEPDPEPDPPPEEEPR